MGLCSTYRRIFVRRSLAWPPRMCLCSTYWRAHCSALSTHGSQVWLGWLGDSALTHIGTPEGTQWPKCRPGILVDQSRPCLAISHAPTQYIPAHILQRPRHTRPPEMTGVARGLSPDTCSHDKRRALYLKWRRPNLVDLLLNHPSLPNALHTVANSAGLVLPARIFVLHYQESHMK